MAQSAVIGGITFSATCSYTSAGQFLADYSIGEREYARQYITAPGIDGQGSKNFGFRNQRIVLHVEYVASSADGVVTAMQNDIDTLTASASTLVLAGETYYGCFVDAGGFKQKGVPKSTGLPSALFTCEATIVVDSKRLA